MTPTQPISLLLCALGGEGGGVLTDWLIDAARHAGYAAQATSVPGVAQRTGATTYYLEVFPVPLAELAGRRPVFGLNPLPGRLDALVSSELLETGRQIGAGMCSDAHTLVITSSARALTTHEKMVMGDGRRDPAGLLQLVRTHSRAHHVLDMAALSREAGTIVSAVMLGALAASGLLPFARQHYESALGTSASASLRGFALAHDAVSRQREQAQYVQAVLSDDPVPRHTPPALPPALAQAFPPAVHDLLALGHARVCEYQDTAYGAQYGERLARVLAAEQAGDPGNALGHATTRETARWLALWMAFDDIVRVADLKSRASRRQRVAQEVRQANGDLLRVYDHFKPGAPEFAALLPPALARRVLAWDAARQARGQGPWALPLKVASHSVRGLLALRGLASLRWLRRRGQRFATEQSLIERWLLAIEQAARQDAALGLALARCGQLVKGYGSTNERGKDNLLHIVDHLARPGAAAAVDQARDAALSDEAGQALDRTLQQHGAPARPVKPQPIRWHHNPRLKARNSA